MNPHREPAVKPSEMSLGQTQELVIALGKAGLTKADIQRGIEDPSLIKIGKKPATRAQVIDALGSDHFFDESISQTVTGLEAQNPFIAYSHATLQHFGEQNRLHKKDWCLMYLQGFSVVELCRKFHPKKKNPLEIVGYEKLMESGMDMSWAFQRPLGGYYLINFGEPRSCKTWTEVSGGMYPSPSCGWLLEALLVRLFRTKEKQPSPGTLYTESTGLIWLRSSENQLELAALTPDFPSTTESVAVPEIYTV